MDLSKTIKTLKIDYFLKKTFPHFKRGSKTMDISKFKKYETQQFFVESFQVLTVSKQLENNRHIIFLHGGAYTHEALFLHRVFFEKLVKLNFKVTFINYPLAPENNAVKTHDVLLKSYLKLIKKFPNDKFFLLGDSAGGGLALSFLMQLRDKKVVNKIKKTVLLSPWVDVSMSNENIDILQKNDGFLNKESLIYSGQLYAQNLSAFSPIVSPIYGNFENLNNFLVFAGENEILIDDIKKCCDKIKEYNEIELYVEKNMFHDYVVAPIKEAKVALKKINQFLN